MSSRKRRHVGRHGNTALETPMIVRIRAGIDSSPLLSSTTTTTTMQSPRLPWEVLERVVGHSGDHPETLCSLSLTCRQLLPRSRCGMMAAGVLLKSRDHAFALVDFLQTNPHLKSFITSIRIKPHDLPPFPLLHILSNLSQITFARQAWVWWPFELPSLNPSYLTCCQRFGSHIQTLSFFRTSFSSPLVLAQLLLAFSNIAHLVCNKVDVKMGDVRNQAPLAVLKKRLSEKLRLRSLVIQSGSLSDAGIVDVLLDPMFKLASSWVESLEIISGSITSLKGETFLALKLPEWSCLKFFKFNAGYLGHDHGEVEHLIKILDSVKIAACTDFILEFATIFPFLIYNVAYFNNNHTSKLEQTLLKFSRISIIWKIKDPIHPIRNMFWTREFKRIFPLLSQRGNTLIVKSETVYFAGHNDDMLDFAFSPDGKWTATVSKDGTIILWNPQDGSIGQELAFPGYESVSALTFSHNCRYLVGGSTSSTVVVWDLQNINHIVATVTCASHQTCPTILSCAWSSDDATVVIAMDNYCIKLWKPSTSAALDIQVPAFARDRDRSLKHVAFSPLDGTVLLFTWDDGTVATYSPYS